MIPDKLRQQIDRWLDGDLPQGEEAQLKQSLEQTPKALEYLSDRALLHTMLSSSAAFNPSPLQVVLNHSKVDYSSTIDRSQPNRRIAQHWIWGTSAFVACLLLISMILLPNVLASPAELVQKTLSEYRMAIDRCYTVKVESEGRQLRKRLPARAVPADSKLWVRGNSFVQFFDPSVDQLVWGRDAQGAVWFTLAGKSAAVFEANEIPDVLQDVCDLRTLDVTTLLESLLRDYDLKYTDREDSNHTILASPRPKDSDSKFGTVEIEIDARSRLVRRVTLERLKAKRAVAVISFTLEEMINRQDSFYEVESHLQPNAEVLRQGSGFGKRSDLLREFLQKLRFPNVNT